MSSNLKTMPTPSEPPPSQPSTSINEELALITDYGWWLVRTYKTVASARTVASELRTGKRKILEGEWEFRTGPYVDGGGLWARRLS